MLLHSAHKWIERKMATKALATSMMEWSFFFSLLSFCVFLDDWSIVEQDALAGGYPYPWYSINVFCGVGYANLHSRNLGPV